MMTEIEADTRRTAYYTGIEALSDRVISAFQEVDRRAFVPDALDYMAYMNRPLPIGEGQTISQPFIVALMTELADIEASDTVLEIGTGSGYQAAILSRLAKKVISIEIIESLAVMARSRLKQEGYTNVDVHVADGSFGWPDGAPYDAILVTAAAETVPLALIEQLACSGSIIIPVGGEAETQFLMKVSKDKKCQLTQRNVLAVRFVPFTGANQRR